MKSKQKTMRLTLMAMFLAVEMVLTFTPLGYIPLGFMNMTTMHIPVIIAGITLGVQGGAVIGLVFGISSIIRATMMPLPTSFVFSPFITVGGISGNFASLIIAIVPRVMIGVCAALLYQLLIRKKVNDNLAVVLSGICGAMVNTILVMGGIFIFFGKSYAAATSVAYDLLLKVIMGVVTTNGIVEAILGAIIVLAVCKVLRPFMKKYTR